MKLTLAPRRAAAPARFQPLAAGAEAELRAEDRLAPRRQPGRAEGEVGDEAPHHCDMCSDRANVSSALMKNAALLFFVAVSAFAQAPIRLPEQSPAASVGQTIGVTDINVT